MITSEQIQEFKIRLEKERDILQKELSSIGTQNPSNPDDWEPSVRSKGEFGPDQNENADIVESLHENNAAINELEVRLKNVRDALVRIEEGTYGVCEESGNPIELDRLNANPAARTCLERASK